MRRFFITVLLVFTSLYANAQGRTGKIFILGDTSANKYYTQTFGTFYGNVIESGSILPAAISNYDAILLFTSRSAADTLSYGDQLRTIDYLKNGGRVYVQGFPLLHGDPGASIDTLWHFLGDESEFCEAIEVWWDAYSGIDSEFTKGITLTWTHSDPLQFDGEPCGMGGNLIPVFLEHEGNDNIDDAVAWRSFDPTIKAVLGMHDLPNIFYDRLLCGYFGLCTDIVKESNLRETPTLRLVTTGTQTTISTSMQAGTLDVFNSLGVSVLCVPTVQGGTNVRIPSTLPAGAYFAVLRIASGTACQRFIQLPK